jgi:CYTH domain-containing protein
MLRRVTNPSAPSGKSEKYARPERERRWLLREPPSPSEVVREVEIEDLYFVGTRLRLRCWRERSAESTIYKLTQKVPGANGSFPLVTNTYLSEAEYKLLRQLGGAVLKKLRQSVPPLGVDVFEAPLHGLVLAEAEFATDDEMNAFPPPATTLAEVTDDERFSGGRLAGMRRDDLVQALAQYGFVP